MVVGASGVDDRGALDVSSWDESFIAIIVVRSRIKSKLDHMLLFEPSVGATAQLSF